MDDDGSIEKLSMVAGADPLCKLFCVFTKVSKTS
jgi:hypothetical protein